jgi:hypothetical protein
MTSSEKTGLLAKVINLLQTRRRAPPPRLGDGKYNSEEDGNTVKSGVIKALQGRKLGIPAELDLYLELLGIAKAGGADVTIPEMVCRCPCAADGVNCRLRDLWGCSRTTARRSRSWLARLQRAAGIRSLIPLYRRSPKSVGIVPPMEAITYPP